MSLNFGSNSVLTENDKEILNDTQTLLNKYYSPMILKCNEFMEKNDWRKAAMIMNSIWTTESILHLLHVNEAQTEENDKKEVQMRESTEPPNALWDVEWSQDGQKKSFDLLKRMTDKINENLVDLGRKINIPTEIDATNASVSLENYLKTATFDPEILKLKPNRLHINRTHQHAQLQKKLYGSNQLKEYQ